MKNELKHCS